MLEKLIEGWLDKINERGYQPAFCTALAAQGHTILHNTRHSPMELGKDVVACAGNGNVNLYQLKGDPGGRMTGNEFRTLIPQLDQLMTLAWDAGAPPNSEFPYLVTNGYVEEEARIAIAAYNARHVAAGRQPLNVIDRGIMLSMFVTQLQAFFPTDPDRLRRLLEFMGVPGDEPFDAKSLQSFLLETYDARPGDPASSLTRASFAVAILSELISGNSVVAENYFETIKCRVCCFAAILSWHHKAQRTVSPEVDAILGMLRSEIFSDIDALEIDYIVGGERLSRAYFADNILINWRREVMGWLFAASLVEHKIREMAGVSSNLDPAEVDSRSTFCRMLLEDGPLWGERSQLAHLAAYFGLSAGSGNGDSDIRAMRLMMSFRHLLGREIGTAFPNLYYDYERVTRALHFPELRTPESTMPDDNFWRRSRVLEAFFLLACRKNFKDSAKSIWDVVVSFTHMGANRISLDRFALPVDEELTEREKMFEESIDWFEALTLAEEHAFGDGVAFFRFDVSVAMVWLLFFPYRFETEFGLTLDRIIQNSMNLEKPDRGRDEALARIVAYG